MPSIHHDPLNSQDKAFIRLFKPDEIKSPATFESEKLGLSKEWKLPSNIQSGGAETINFNEHDLKSFLHSHRLDSKLIDQMFSIVTKLNPELAEIKINDKDKFDALYGVASRYDVSDIKFYIEKQKTYSAEELGKRAIVQGVYYKDIQYMISPQNLDKLYSQLPEPNQHQKKDIETVNARLKSYGNQIVRYQNIMIERGCRIQSLSLDKHKDKQIRAINDIKQGDVVLLEGKLHEIKSTNFEHTELENEKGESFKINTGQFKERLLSATDEVAIYTAKWGSSYSDHPAALLPEHYVEEEKLNIYSSIIKLGKLSKIDSARICELVAEKVKERLLLEDPETGKSQFELDDLTTISFKGKDLHLITFNQDEKYRGIGHVTIVPLILSEKLEKQPEVIQLLQDNLVVPPANDKEVIDFINELASLNTRPEYSKILETINTNDKIMPYIQYSGDSHKITALLAGMRLILALDQLPELGAHSEHVQEHLTQYMSLFRDTVIKPDRSWVQCKDPTKPTQYEREFIEFEGRVLELDKTDALNFVSKTIQLANDFNSNYKVEPEQFERIMSDHWFARCSVTDSYHLLSQLDQKGKDNLEKLLSDGLLVIRENPFETPNIKEAIRALNTMNYTDLSDSAKKTILEKKEENLIFLSILPDSRTISQGHFLSLGSPAWANFK